MEILLESSEPDLLAQLSGIVLFSVIYTYTQVVRKTPQKYFGDEFLE